MPDPVQVEVMGGMAPKCKLLSLKVLDDAGQGKTSNLIAAHRLRPDISTATAAACSSRRQPERRLRLRARWFACGQSPLCVEVDRLVRSGRGVVVAAGNTGYGVGADRDPRRGRVPAST